MDFLAGRGSSDDSVDILMDGIASHGEKKEHDHDNQQVEESSAPALSTPTTRQDAPPVIEQQQQQKQNKQPAHALYQETPLPTNHGTSEQRTPPLPASSLFDKLGRLEQQWTDQVASTKRKRQAQLHRSTNSKASSSSPYLTGAHFEDCISPLTIGGESYSFAAVSSPAAIMTRSGNNVDDKSISTYGSLGSPTDLMRSQSLSYAIDSRSRQSHSHRPARNAYARKASPKDVFSRLNRGEKRSPSSARPFTGGRRLFSSMSPLPPAGSSLGRPSKSPNSKPTTRCVIERSFSFKSDKSHQSSVTSTATEKRSVFERLYRRERRSNKVWTDPGAKRGKRFKFVASDGAAKANIIAAGNKLSRKRLPFTDHDFIDGATASRLATAIQTLWRLHTAQSELIGKLVKSYQVVCSEVHPMTSNKILLLKYKSLACTEAIRQANIYFLTESLSVRGGDCCMYLANRTDVSFEVWDEHDMVVNQQYTVFVEIDAAQIEFICAWSKQKVAYLLHRYALEAHYKMHADKLMHTAARFLQNWFFFVAYKNRKNNASISPVPSSVLDSSLHRQLAVYESLSWFHDRLLNDAVAAKMTKIEVAAQIIQATYRRWVAKRFLEALRGVQDLKLLIAQRLSKAKLNDSIVRVQAGWRGHLSRRELMQQVFQAPAQIMQSFARMCLSRVRYLRFVQAIVALQRCHKRQKRNLLLQHRVVCIQSAFRSWLARRQTYANAAAAVASEVQCAWILARLPASVIDNVDTIIRLQSLFRMSPCAARYQETKQATTLLQAWFRGIIQRLRYQKHYRACISIQAAIRSWRLRQEVGSILFYKRTVLSTLVVQAWWRGLRVRQHLSASKSAALAIQQEWGKRDEIRIEHAAAIKVQSFCRMLLSKRSYRLVFSGSIRNSSATVIQSRGQLTHAIVVWQSVWRGFKLRMLEAAVLMQANGRGYLVRNRLSLMKRATITIQQTWKVYLIREKARKQRRRVSMAVLAIQQLARASSRRTSERKIRAACCIQHSWRVFLLRQAQSIAAQTIQFCWHEYYNREHSYMNCKATTIQKCIRCYSARIAYRRRLAAILRLQSWWLGKSSGNFSIPMRLKRCLLKVQHRVPLLKEEANAVKAIRFVLQSVLSRNALVIQAWYRGLRVRQAFIVLYRASQVLQRYYRSHLVHLEYLFVRSSAIAIQSFCRSYLQKRTASVVKIQSILRGIRVRKAFHASQRFASALQRAWKATIRRNERRKNIAAITIQSNYRSHAPRQAYRLLQISAIQVQVFIRGFLARKLFMQYRRLALLTQRAWRRYCEGVVVAQMKLRRSSAKAIQTAWRSFFASACYSHLRRSTILVQSVHRMRFKRLSLLAATSSATKLQACCRMSICRGNMIRYKIAANVVQRVWRAHFDRMRRQEAAATTLQSKVRALLVRNDFLERIRKTFLLQTWCRTWLLQRRLLHFRQAVIRLQSTCRRKQVQQLITSWKSAAVRIEKVYSKKRELLPRRLQRKAAVVIQRYVRAWICRKNWATLRLAAAMIPVRTMQKFSMKVSERLWGQRLRHFLRDRINLATKIETWWRSVYWRSSFKTKRKSAVVLQHWSRVSVIPTVFIRKSAAARLQAWWKMMEASNNYASLRVCSTVISTSTQMRMLPRIEGPVWGRVRRELYHRMLAATTIQKWWQMTSFRTQCKQRMTAVLVLQKSGRRWIRVLNQKRTNATLTIQTFVRVFVTQARFVAMKQAATRIQTSVRRLITRSKFLRVLSATLLIQCNVRRHVILRARKQNQAAAHIQGLWKSHVAKKNYALLVICSDVISKTTREKMMSKIQLHSWGWKLRNQLALRATAAVTVQAFWRMQKMHRWYQRTRLLILLMQAQAKQSWLPLIRKRRSRKVAATVIQSLWRAQAQRSHYLAIFGAAVTIQRHIHHKVMPQLRKQNLAAMRLQAWFRMRICVRNYNILVSCFSLIPSVTINTMISRVQQSSKWGARIRNQLVTRLKSALLIQSLWRMHRERKQYKKQRRDVVFLQTTGMRILQAFVQRRLSATKIQCKWRSFYAIHNYNRQRCAAVVLQTKGMRFFRILLQERSSATKVQSQWRRYHSRTTFLELRSSLLLLQTLARTRHLRKAMQVQKAAECIQTKIRSYACRQSYLRYRKSAVHLQAAFRQYMQHQKYTGQIQSARLIQGAWKLRYQQPRQKCMLSARVIQSAWRRRKERRQFLLVRSSASILQTVFRMLRSRKPFVSLRNSAVFIQRFFRSSRTRKEFRSKKNAAIFLQYLLRFQRRKKQVESRQNAAVLLIQCAFRVSRARRDFLSKRNAAIYLQQTFFRNKSNKDTKRRAAIVSLQSHWRAFASRKEFERCVQAVICLQHNWRLLAMRKKATRIREMNMASLKIQAWLRQRNANVLFRMKLKAVLLLWPWVRGILAKIRVLRLRKSIVTLQAAIRRSLRVAEFRLLRRNVIAIQSRMRTYLSRKAYLSKKSASHIIQGFFRGAADFRKYQLIRNSTVMIQMAFRRFRLRTMTPECIAIDEAVAMIQLAVRKYLQKRLESARTLQAFFRMWRERNAYVDTLSYVVKAQSLWRSMSTRKRHRSLVYSAVKIQKSLRRHWKHAKRRLGLLETKANSAMSIQRVYRGFVERAIYTFIRFQITRFQAIFRSYIRAKYFVHIIRAVCKLQGLLRGASARRSLKQKAAASVVIQQLWRTQAQQSLKRNRPSTLVSSSIEQAGIILIQSMMRRKYQQHKFASIRAGAILMQAHSRAINQRKSYRSQRHASIKIQSFLRGRFARVVFVRRQQAVTSFQASCRMHRQRRFYRSVVTTVEKLQCLARRKRAQRSYIFARACATLLQAQFRSYRQRKAFQQWRYSIIIVQSWCRQRLARIRTKEAIQMNKVQKATLVVQSVLRMYPQRSEFCRFLAGLLQLQSIARGWRTRRLIQAQALESTKIQQLWRSTQYQNLVLQEQTTLRLEERSAIAIQSIWRRKHCRGNYIHVRAAVTLMQACFRASRVQSMKVQCSAATKIQSRIRGNLHRKLLQSQEIRRKEMDASALLVQTIYRMHVYKRRFSLWRLAAIKLQCALRTRLARRSLNLYIAYITVIQKTWRGNLCRVAHKKKQQLLLAEQQKERCIILLQSSWRKTTSRHQYLCARAKTILIQAFVKKFIQRQLFLSSRNAVVSIQARTRRHQVTPFASQKKHVLIIQSMFRGHQKRKELAAQRMLVEVTSIDAASGLEEAKKVAAQDASVGSALRQQLHVHSAIALQKTYRMRSQRRKFVAVLSATVKMQSILRRCLVKKTKAYFLATIVIQSWWRRHKVYARVGGKRLHEARYLVAALESLLNERMRPGATRAILMSYGIAASVTDPLNEQIVAALIRIQSWFRGAFARRLLVKQRHAASVIQQSFILWKLDNSLLALKSAAVLMKRSLKRQLPPTAGLYAFRQASRELRFFVAYRYRFRLVDSYQDSDIDNCVAMCQHFGAVQIQRYYIRNVVARKHALAMLTSGSWFVDVQANTKLRSDVQSWLLVYKSTTLLADHRSSARKIQAWFRMRQWKSQRTFFHIIRRNALIIQSIIRMFLVATAVKKRREAAFLLQGYFKQAFSRRVTRYFAILKLQCFFRFFIARNRLSRLRNEHFRMLEAVNRGRVLKASLLDYFSRKIYEQADRASKLEVDHLLSHDEISVQDSTPCVRRLAHNVVLRRLDAEFQRNAINEAEELCKYERTNLKRMANCLGVAIRTFPDEENIKPSGQQRETYPNRR